MGYQKFFVFLVVCYGGAVASASGDCSPTQTCRFQVRGGTWVPGDVTFHDGQLKCVGAYHSSWDGASGGWKVKYAQDFQQVCTKVNGERIGLSVQGGASYGLGDKRKCQAVCASRNGGQVPLKAAPGVDNGLRFCRVHVKKDDYSVVATKYDHKTTKMVDGLLLTGYDCIIGDKATGEVHFHRSKMCYCVDSDKVDDVQYQDY